MQLKGIRLWLPRPMRSSLLSLVLGLLLLVLHAAAPALAAAKEGHSVRPLHGPGYEHLDCSACLTVSRALFRQLNNTLHQNPSTYLVSHRLNRENQLKRLPYRNSELLVTEVMDNFCTSYQNDERTLRLHPQSKVRLYHQQVWKDLSLGVRPSLREDEVYPADAYDPQWEKETELKRYPIAKIYSPADQEALHGMAMLAATPTMCATLVEEFEEEIEEMVKLARNLSDIEYGLCGLPLPVSTDNVTAAETEQARAAIQPITNICARTEVLREAAHRDQLRWSQFMRREARRLQKIEEKETAAETTATEEKKEEGREDEGEHVSSENGNSATAEDSANAPEALENAEHRVVEIEAESTDSGYGEAAATGNPATSVDEAEDDL